MIDHNTETELRAEVANLKAQVAHDNETRRQLLAAADAAIPKLAKQQEQWATLFAASVETVRRSQEIGDARQDGLLPQLAIIKTRVRALEEAFHEMAGIVIEDHTTILEIADIARRFRE